MTHCSVDNRCSWEFCLTCLTVLSSEWAEAWKERKSTNSQGRQRPFKIFQVLWEFSIIFSGYKTNYLFYFSYCRLQVVCFEALGTSDQCVNLLFILVICCCCPSTQVNQMFPVGSVVYVKVCCCCLVGWLLFFFWCCSFAFESQKKHCKLDYCVFRGEKR